MQNLDAAHETAISDFGPLPWLAVHFFPLNAKIWPSKFEAMQNRGVVHENTQQAIIEDSRRSGLVRRPGTAVERHKGAWPPRNAIGADRCAKVDVGHETLYVSPAGPIGTAEDQTLPLYTSALPAATATQNSLFEHDTESIDPPNASD